MDFKTIDKSNYRECMELQVEESQKYFVADNTRSLVEAAYEDGLYTLGVYDGDTMVGVCSVRLRRHLSRLVDEPVYDRPSVSGQRLRQAGRPGVS